MIGLIGILGCVIWATLAVAVVGATCAIGFAAADYVAQQEANDRADTARLQEKMQAARRNRITAIKTLSKATEGQYISMFRESMLENDIRNKGTRARELEGRRHSAPERNYGRPI